MDKDVAAYVAKCDVCNSQPAEQGKEPLICHELPTRLRQKIAVDLFDLNGTEFMVTVNYYSNFYEVDRLTSKRAEKVVKKLKAHLARHGIPNQLVSENGQPFSSAKFQEFANSYDFNHVTSSPAYPQSNRKAENAVKTKKPLSESSKVRRGPIPRTPGLEEHPHRNPELFKCSATIWKKNQDPASDL